MRHLWVFALLFLGSAIPEQPIATCTMEETRFMVFSDPHYYDPSLGVTGEAFQSYLDQDRKLLRESSELLDEAITMICRSEAEFVMVPGDLTKDGTLVSHQQFAAKMAQLEKSGLEVYVVPGNHDISNGEAYAFREDTVILQENVGPGHFAEIYREFGYDEAIFRDTSSLSYVVEPAEGLWLIGLDACIYEDNRPNHHPVTGGRVRSATLEWLADLGKKATEQEKNLMAFMHHGVLEHYKGQQKHFGQYIVEDHKKISSFLASLGIKVVFTGHYHAQDITMKRWRNDRFLADVETGSLVTYPCPVREGRITGDILELKTHYIRSIASRSDDFMEYSRTYVHEGVSGIAEKTLVDMNLRPGDAANLSGQIGDAFVAHYAGDEEAPEQPLDLSGVNLKGRIIISFRKKLVKGLYNDLPPADNELVLSLTSGKTAPLSR